MKLDLKKLADEENNGKPVKVVANLPYYITTPIIMGLFENEVPVESITVMVQKEVADRMQTGPGNKDYGGFATTLTGFPLFSSSASFLRSSFNTSSLMTRTLSYPLNVSSRIGIRFLSISTEIDKNLIPILEEDVYKRQDTYSL